MIPLDETETIDRYPRIRMILRRQHPDHEIDSEIIQDAGFTSCEVCKTKVVRWVSCREWNFCSKACIVRFAREEWKDPENMGGPMCPDPRHREFRRPLGRCKHPECLVREVMES